MYEFFLDGTRVEEPESFSNISFEKKRDPKLFGFLVKSVGKVVGAGQIKFTQPLAVQLLRAAKKKDGYGAIIKFKVNYQGHLAYEGTVNLWAAEWYAHSVVVTFSDSSRVLKFITNSSNRYQIATNTYQTLSSAGIIGKTTHQISNVINVYRSKTAGAVDYSHPIPLVQGSGSSNATVNEILNFDAIQPLYTNDSEKKTLSIKGQVFFNVKTDNGGSFQVKLNDLILQQYASGSVETTTISIIDKAIVLEPYQTLSLSVVSLANSADTTFSYDVEKSGLSINEIKDNLKPTDVPCIATFDLLEKLLKRASDNEMYLESSFLKGLKHNWTNGKNIRGVDSLINASFTDVYEDLDRMYCLYTTVYENKIKIERRADIKRHSARSILKRDRIAAEVQYPNHDYLFSVIKAGYKNWQGESALSNQEINASLELQSNLFGRENVLSLECNCIASGILIEEIRQQQFGKVSTDQQKKYDDTLVLLIENDGHENYKSSGLNADSLNLSVRPYQIAANWANVLGGYKHWRFISGLGNTEALINGFNQKRDISTFGNVIQSGEWNIEYECELWEFNNIGEIIGWMDTNGRQREGILMEAQWYQTNSGNRMILRVMEDE